MGRRKTEKERRKGKGIYNFTVKIIRPSLRIVGSQQIQQKIYFQMTIRNKLRITKFE